MRTRAASYPGRLAILRTSSGESLNAKGSTMNGEHKPAPKPDEIRRAKAGHIGKTEVVHYPPKAKPPQKPAPKPAQKPQPSFKKYEQPPTLLRAVEELKRLEATLTALKQPTHSLNPFRAQLQESFEAIPINWDGVANIWVLGFVLLGGEWVPFHASEDCNPASAFAGGVFYAIKHTDGTSSQGPCKAYEWAHCTADDHVNYHWLDAVDEPEPDAAARNAILYEAAKLAKNMDRLEALKGIREMFGLNVDDEEAASAADFSHVPEG